MSANFSYAVLAVLALLAPAAAVAKDDEPKPEHPIVKMEPGHGLVLLRVATNRQPSQFFAKWEVMMVQNLTTRKRHRLVDRYLAKARHAHFLESLPPGEYEIENFESSQAGFLTLSAGVRIDSTAWRFSVEAGRLTNLGTLLMVRPYYPANTAELRIVHAADAELPARSAFLFEPQQRGTVLKDPLGWRAIPPDAGPASLKPETRRLSMFLAGGAPGRDGSTLFGEQFGQIARRQRGGTWLWEDTGTLETIMAAVESGDGTLYAVAENSVLLTRPAQGDWRPVEVPVPGARPCLIYTEADGSLTTLWEQEHTLTLLTYRAGAEQPWVEQRRFPMTPTIFVNGQARCSAFPREQKLIVLVTTPRFNSPRYAFEVFDRAGNAWTHHETKLYGPISVFADSSIYSMSGPNIKQTFRVSRDFGKTWDTRGSPNWSGQPVFRSATEGFLLRTDDIPMKTPEKLENSLWRTSDGGRTWQKHADVPNLMAALLLVPDGMLLVTSGGKMYFSADDGKTLSLERDSSQPVW